MITHCRMPTIVAILVGISLGRGPASTAGAAELTAKQVLDAIERGQRYMLAQQDGDGSWGLSGALPLRYKTGLTSVVLLALINSGMTIEDKRVENGIKFLRNLPEDEPTGTYNIALTISALAAAKDGQRDKARLLSLVQRLENLQVKNGENTGLWAYGFGARDSLQLAADRSNGQYAILGLRDAAHAGIPVSRETWRRALDHWTKHQNKDGGWGYRVGESSTGSMTVAGISSVVIAESMLSESDDLNPDGTPVCCPEQEPNQTLDRAIKWMAANFSVRINPRGNGWLLYYLYGLERAGRLSGTRFFGDHDWYREGAQFLVQGQDLRRGFWPDAAPGALFNNLPATSFALLFLSKGLSPVLINKLKFGPLDQGKPGKRKQNVNNDWRRSPKDAHNLTEMIATLEKWPKLLTWQVVDFNKLIAQKDAPELHQAPVLYISGRDRLQFDHPRQIELLQQYVDQGGFIFAVANCNGAEFEEGVKTLVKRMFPSGEAKLRRLSADHPVFRSEYPLDATTVELYGVDFGCRTVLMYSPYDLSCLWDKWARRDPPQRSKEAKLMITKATHVGVNVVAYATGRELLNKLEEQAKYDQAGAQDKIERGLLQVAKLRHTGNWDAAPHALRNLLMAMNQTAGMAASTRPVNLPASDPTLFNYPVLFMHGKNSFQISNQEAQQISKYLDQGGVLFADSVCGSKQFDESFRQLMKRIFPDRKLERIPVTHEMFSTGIGNDVRRVRRRVLDIDDPNRVIDSSVRDGEPFLEGIEVDGRYAVIYSKYDISCSLQRQASVACAGYVEDDAVKIAVNIMLYAMLQDVGAPKAAR